MHSSCWVQAKKREGELVTKVSAMEAEMQSAQAVAAQSTQAVDDLRSQLAVSLRTLSVIACRIVTGGVLWPGSSDTACSLKLASCGITQSPMLS